MYVLCRHEESVVDGRGEKVGDPFITRRASRRGGMTRTRVDNIVDLLADYWNDIVDLLADYWNSETVVIIICTIAFAVYIELYLTPNYYQ